MKWTKNNTLEFLELYKSQPAIWSRKNPNHKNREAVECSWKTIKNSLSFECPIKEMKNKKDMLMATFKTILRKLRAHGIADADIGNYNSVWYAYKTMASFLLKTQTKSETQKPAHVSNDDHSEKNVSERIGFDSTDRNEYVGEKCVTQARSLKRPHKADETLKKRVRPSFTVKTTQNYDDKTHSMVNDIKKPSVQKTADECSLFIGELKRSLKRPHKADETLKKRVRPSFTVKTTQNYDDKTHSMVNYIKKPSVQKTADECSLFIGEL